MNSRQMCQSKIVQDDDDDGYLNLSIASLQICQELVKEIERNQSFPQYAISNKGGVHGQDMV